MMKKKYIIPNEAKTNWLYKPNTLDTNQINQFLIKLRTLNRSFLEQDKRLAAKVSHFNKVVKHEIDKKGIDAVTNIIKTFINEDGVL